LREFGLKFGSVSPKKYGQNNVEGNGGYSCADQWDSFPIVSPDAFPTSFTHGENGSLLSAKFQFIQRANSLLPAALFLIQSG
jgi:hypothetical protein